MRKGSFTMCAGKSEKRFAPRLETLAPGAGDARYRRASGPDAPPSSLGAHVLGRVRRDPNLPVKLIPPCVKPRRNMYITNHGSGDGSPGGDSF